MIVVFEGPDKAGKSTSAANVSSSGEAVYNATKENYEEALHYLKIHPGETIGFDRIDWLTHMAYRLALPGYEWNDERVRTVFPMPEAHLVFKLHRTEKAHMIDDELYTLGKVGVVNDFYHSLAGFINHSNRQKDFKLFKTVSIIEVANNTATGGDYKQDLLVFSTIEAARNKNPGPIDDKSLIDMLKYNDAIRV